MKGHKILLIFFVIASIFSGCQSEDSAAKAPPNTSEKVASQATDGGFEDDYVCEYEADVVYTEEVLKEIESSNLPKTELLQLYPTPYIREYDGETHCFYYSETSVVNAVFDSDSNRHRGRAASSIKKISPSKETFENIKIGDSLEIVETLDPNGYYDLVYYSGSHTNYISIHYTSDKYVIWIYYDTNFLVKNIDIQSMLIKE